MGCFWYYIHGQRYGFFDLDSYGNANKADVIPHLPYCGVVSRLTQFVLSYLKINNIEDRCQKIIYLFVDGALNYYFVRLVNQQLVNLGLEKYKPLATFNTRIVVLSVAMDVSN